jgi:adenine phosphoribosyltransferase
MSNNYKDHIPTIEDFPVKGISFKDTTGLLEDPAVFENVITDMCATIEKGSATHIVGIESRGFLFGCVMASRLKLPFVPIRKKGKLPRPTVQQSYSLEYGEAVIELTKGLLGNESRVIIVDDLLATGGTFKAAATLCEKEGAQVVKFVTVVELPALGGRKNLEPYEVTSLISYDDVL